MMIVTVQYRGACQRSVDRGVCYWYCSPGAERGMRRELGWAAWLVIESQRCDDRGLGGRCYRRGGLERRARGDGPNNGHRLGLCCSLLKDDDEAMFVLIGSWRIGHRFESLALSRPGPCLMRAWRRLRCRSMTSVWPKASVVGPLNGG